MVSYHPGEEDPGTVPTFLMWRLRHSQVTSPSSVSGWTFIPCLDLCSEGMGLRSWGAEKQREKVLEDRAQGQ